MGADLRLNTRSGACKNARVRGIRRHLRRSGAPKGKELDLPGRHDSERVHIGITWSSRWPSARRHIGERVLIIGVGKRP